MHKGASFTNEASIFVSEYNRHKILRKLGYNQNIDELDDLWLDAFICIESELNRIQEAEMRKAKKGWRK